jgi:ABC-type microcin C transport system permease subunit YejB
LKRFILGRLVATIPVMGVVATVVFLLLRLSPGDPATILAGDAASPEQIAAIRTRLGLDQPILVQFAEWMWRLLQGDLGTSIISNQPVTKLIGERLEPTLALAITTIIFAVAVAVPSGCSPRGGTGAGSTAASWRCRCSGSRSRSSCSATCGSSPSPWSCSGCPCRATSASPRASGRSCSA